MKNKNLIIKMLVLAKCLIVLTSGYIFSQTIGESNNLDLKTFSNVWAYFPLNGNFQDESGNVRNGNGHAPVFTADRFDKQNSALKTKFYVKDTSPIPTDQATICFWFKKLANNSNDLLYIAKKDQQLIEVKYTNWSKSIIFNYFKSFDKKSVFTGNVELKCGELLEDEWNFICCSYNNSEICLSINGQTPVKSTINSIKYKDSRPPMSNAFTFGSDFLALDDIIIFDKAMGMGEENKIYAQKAYNNNLNKPIIFKDPVDVFNYLDKKTFSRIDEKNANYQISFYDNGNSAILNHDIKLKKIDGYLKGERTAVVSYYDHDPRLETKFEVNASSNTVKLIPITGQDFMEGEKIFKLSNSENNVSVTNINEGWISKAVIKFQMLNPSTKNWEEIVFYEPDQNIKIRNDKDVLIDDTQIMSYIAGRNVSGYFKALQFVNARQENTTAVSAKRFVGSFELLDNHNMPSEKAETAVYFFYGNNNKLGCIEIQSYLCRCKARIFVDDFKEGLDFIDY